MRAVERHLHEINRVEREIKKTQSWKRKNDLIKYHKRLKRELAEYVSYQGL